MKFTALLSFALAASAVSAEYTTGGSIRHMLQRRDANALLSSGVHVEKRAPGEMPVIDLGYVKQRASSFGTAGDVDYYLFKNVRFAAPPLGELRFKKPAPPLVEKEIQDGNYNSTTACVQPGILTGGTDGAEDCLFLDIYVPSSALTSSTKLPILANWYGGGYVYGTKETGGNPLGLWSAGAPPFIFIAPNYRLGVYGWLSAPDVDIDANAGLYDTLAAMDWIKTYAEKFGGDLDHVTASGLSAGAGVVMHSMVATGYEVPFQQAILQSPGWQPEAVPNGRLPIYKYLLNVAKCTDTACLRNLTTSGLVSANLLTLLAWNTDALGPTSGFYPVPDGKLLMDHPANLFTEGKVHKTVKRVIASSARWESSGQFATPSNLSDEGFREQVKTDLTTDEAIIDKIVSVYPPDGTPKSGYNRGRDFIGDLGFNCNSLWVLRHFGGKATGGKTCPPKGSTKAWKVEWNVGTAGHGSDWSYTWLDAKNASVTGQLGASADRMKYQQDWVIGFVADEKADWKKWKVGREVAWWINDTSVGEAPDYFDWEKAQERCDLIRTEVITKGPF